MHLRGACSKCHQAREERNRILCHNALRSQRASALNELRDPTLREAAVRPGETERKSRKTVDQTGVGMSVD